MLDMTWGLRAKRLCLMGLESGLLSRGNSKWISNNFPQRKFSWLYHLENVHVSITDECQKMSEFAVLIHVTVEVTFKWKCSQKAVYNILNSWHGQLQFWMWKIEEKWHLVLNSEWLSCFNTWNQDDGWLLYYILWSRIFH